jgi:hypothetical protein
MIRWTVIGLLVLTFGMTASSGSAQGTSPFPLADGSRWTLRDVDSRAARTIAARREGNGLVLSGLPGAPDLRVRWSGKTLQAWDTVNSRWEALFRFGAPAGESYTVNLGGTLLWRGVGVTVASKRAMVEDLSGRERRCTRFVFRYKKPTADAGLEWMAFAPGIGPVRIVDTTIAGTRELALAGHRLKAA